MRTYMYWYMCTYFRQFVVGLKKFQNYVLFYQEPEPAPGRKFPEPEPPKNRPAPKPWFYQIRCCLSLNNPLSKIDNFLLSSF